MPKELLLFLLVIFAYVLLTRIILPKIGVQVPT